MRHCLGRRGQQIEREMASQVGTKLFVVNQPDDGSYYQMPADFSESDIDELINHIKAWYNGDCCDMSTCNIFFANR